MNSLGRTEFWNELCDDVLGNREGGAIVIIDAEDARKGVAKTSAAVAFAKAFGHAFGYELQERDLVLSGQEYLSLYNRHPGESQPSICVWDEAVGAGSGDSRRSMSSENVDLGRAWQVMRTRRVVTFVTLPNWGDLDVRLRKLADYRLWCRREPIGQAHAYQIGTDFDGDRLETRGLGPGQGAEPIRFPDMKENHDPHYWSLKRKKDSLIDSGTLDANEALAEHGDTEESQDPDEARREEQIKAVLRAVKPWRDDSGLTYREAAKVVGYSRGWVQDRINEWRDGHYDGLVEVDNPNVQIA